MSNEEIIYQTARNEGLTNELANLIVAQAKHETANFTSSVFLDCNNAFGYSSLAGGPSCPGHSFYKSYSNLIESTREIIAWLRRREREGKFPSLDTITAPVQYADLLKKSGYYEDTATNYGAGLSRWYKNLGIIGGGIALGGILLLFFLMFILPKIDRKT